MKVVLKSRADGAGMAIFAAAANELHCSYETVRKYIRIFQSEGMDIKVLNLNEEKKNEKAQ